MGKLPYMFTDSEDTETPSSSTENLKKKKKKSSILKYTAGNVKKKKCKIHSSKSEPEESEYYKSKSSKSKSKLRGILKHDKESSDEEDEMEPVTPRTWDRCLVGRVPKPVGGRPGRGGGVALVVRKNTGLQGFQSLLAQNSTSSTKRSRSMTRKLDRKKSY